MIKERSLLMNKKGANAGSSLKWIILGVIGFLFLLILIYYSLVVPCQDFLKVKANINLKNSDDILNISKGYFYSATYWIGDQFGANNAYTEIQKGLAAEKEGKPLPPGSVSTCMGYYWHQLISAPLFVWHLLIGMLAGFWIFVIFFASEALVRLGFTRFKNRVLILMGKGAWKILAIGLGYAVLLEIPFVSVFVKAITFEIWPFQVNAIIRSLIIAFYVGLAPAWIEDFLKYRLRMKAERAIVAAQMRAKLERVSLKE